MIEDLAPALLPKDWNVSPIPPSVQLLGDEWIKTGRALALRVPSVIVDGGFNILINPEHTGFALVKIDSVSVYDFDPRLRR
jgi:RES domain-containing protein